MEWETYFQKRILDRGYDYYFDERVEDLRINSNRIKAVVNGTDFYHVEIKLNGNAKFMKNVATRSLNLT